MMVVVMVQGVVDNIVGFGGGSGNCNGGNGDNVLIHVVDLTMIY